MGARPGLCPSLLCARVGRMVWRPRLGCECRLRRIRLVPTWLWRTVCPVVWSEPRLFQSREHHEHAHHQREYHEHLQQYLYQQPSRSWWTWRPRRRHRLSSHWRWWWWRSLWSAQQHSLRKFEIAKRLHCGFTADVDELAECGAECNPGFAQPDEPDDSGPLAGHEADDGYAARSAFRHESRGASSAQLRTASGQPCFDGNGRTRQCSHKSELWNRVSSGLEWRSAAAIDCLRRPQ